MFHLKFNRSLKSLNQIHSLKVIFATFLLLFFSQLSLAQTTITGTIIDQNSQPIPYAHIRIENTNIGTISNEIGIFKLVVDSFENDNSLIVSFIGYKTKIVPVINRSQTIMLTEDVAQLNEVVIVARDNATDYAQELIKKARNAIPKNYPVTSEKHTGFFREKTFWKNDKEPIYIAEAVVESIKGSYTKKTKNGDVKLVEFRKYESEALDSLDTRVYGGSHHIHRFDIVARRDAFLSKTEKYQYQITDTLRQNGKDIIRITVNEENGNSANIYIENESFAIVKAEIKLITDFGRLGDREFYNFSVTYKQNEDGLWRFSNSYYNTAFTKQGQLLNLTSEYVTTNITADYDDIPYLERLQFSEILLDETTAYNPDFWNNYTIIAPSEISESLFKSKDYSSNAETKKKKKNVAFFLKKMSFEFGMAWTSFDITTNTIDYSNTPIELQQNNDASKQAPASFSISILYEVKPYLMVGYSNETKISRTGITSNDLVVASSLNLNPKGRPIMLSPRLNFGFQELDYFLEQFRLENDIEVGGKRLNSDKVDVSLSQRGFRLKPSLFLSIEQSKKLSFFISASFMSKVNPPINVRL